MPSRRVYFIVDNRQHYGNSTGPFKHNSINNATIYDYAREVVGFIQ
jgi:hypothetical protein